MSTPVYLAIRSYNIPHLKKLLKSRLYDLDLEAEGPGWKQTPFMLTVELNRYEMVKILLRHHIDLRLKDSRNGETAVMIAVRFNRLESLQVCVFIVCFSVTFLNCKSWISNEAYKK